MATMKDRLTAPPKKVRPKRTETFIVPPPAVNVDAPQVTVDTEAFTAAIQTLTQTVERLAQQQAAMLEQLQALAAREMPAPMVNMPARPKAFDVAMVFDDEGRPIGARIRTGGGH